jgi:hypothetical protein
MEHCLTRERERVLRAYPGLVTWDGHIFSYFRINVCSFTTGVVWYMISPAPKPTSCRERTRPSSCSKGVCAGQLPCAGGWEGPAGYRELTCTRQAGLAVSCPCEWSFVHPVLDCIAFPGNSDNQDAVGRSTQPSTPGEKQQITTCLHKCSL